MGIIDDFINAIKPEATQTPGKTYNATVSKIDDEGVIWVYVAGSETDTPTASSSAEIKRGDAVNVEWRNNKLYIAGNYSNPSVGTTRVDTVEIATKVASEAAAQAVGYATEASAAAEDAKATADSVHGIAVQAQADADNASEYAARALGNLSTVQSVAETLTWITQHGTMTLTSDVALDPTHVYFTQNDSTGYYIVGSHKYDIVTEPDVDDIGTYYVLTIDESLNNYVGTHLALDTEGLWLLPATSGTNKVLIATGAGSTYTTAGTYIIGASGETLARFATNGLNITTKDSNNNVVEIANLGYGSGNNDSGGTSTAPYYTLGIRKSGSQVGNYSLEEGNDNEASGYSSHAEGNNTEASEWASHAEGRNTTASGYYSHAEGRDTTAFGSASHAEGYHTKANGLHSHAEGDNTKAIGSYSHAGGEGTTAQRAHQTVIGKYNELDTGGVDTFTDGNYAFIVGNGTSDNARADALEINWSGDVFMALDTNAGSGTDYDLYTAINALGWASDVIV